MAKTKRNDGTEELVPLTVVAGLELLAAAGGRPSPAAMLTAALPVSGGDMDPRHAPLALARAGLESCWATRRSSALAAHELPALALARNGGCVLLERADEDGVTIRDARGRFVLDSAALDRTLAGEVLLCGHLDPVNGQGLEEDRALARRNPRLWLLGIFLHERRKLARLVAAAVLLNLCALAVPLYMRAIYDRVVPNLAIESLWALSTGVVLVLVFEFVFKHVRTAHVDAVGVRVGQAVQHRAMQAFLGARGGAGHSAGGLMTALRDVEALALLVPQAVATFLVDMPFFFLYLALIAMIGGWTVLAPIVGAAAMLVVGAACNYALKLASRRASRLMQARHDLASDVTDGLATIKANGAEGGFLHRWDVVSDHFGISAKANRKWTDLPGSLAALVVQLVTVMVIVIGVFQIKAGMMTVGAMIAVTMLTGRAMVPVSAAISVLSRMFAGLSQFAGLAKMIALEPERTVSDPSIRRERIRGDIRLAGVDVAHPGAATPSLQGIGLQVRPGEKVALIGKSGSGKSTLLQCLAGLVEPVAGSITVDGHAIGQHAAAQLRRDIVYAAQDAMLFDTSIWDNILLGLDEPHEDVVETAITASGLDGFVSRTVEGYGRKVGPRGSRLSGGQRQSVLLARALVRDPAVLLLDEPTASMDVQSEQQVIAGLRGAAKGRTLIVATHRMALLDVVDRVIWLDGGRIVADRPRDEVLAMLRDPKPRAAA